MSGQSENTNNSRRIDMCTAPQQFRGADAAVFILMPVLRQPPLYLGVLSPLVPTQPTLRHQHHLHVDVIGLSMQQWRQLIYVQVATARFRVKPGVPPLHVRRCWSALFL